jgi:hypothetical protein
MLLATGSAFFTGATPEERDVRNYLWFHSRLYAHCGVPDWPQRKKAALRRFAHQLQNPWKRRLGMKLDRSRYLAALCLAAVEIKGFVDDAFADAPARSGRPGKPIAGLEAFFVHEFASAYGWAPERTRHTPLRQLVQLHRCIRSSRGEELTDDGEDRLLFEHLKARNAALAAKRTATATN